MGIGWIRPDELGEGLEGLVLIAVAVILFEGALNLDLGRLMRDPANAKPSRDAKPHRGTRPALGAVYLGGRRAKRWF